MVEKFFPNEIVDKVQDIDLNRLTNKGIKGLILDIDNTLVPSFMKEANNDALDWIEKVKNRGFKLCIVSNATKRRVDKFNKKIKLEAIYRASKPISRSFRKALKLLGLRACETATVGDQIFTDVYGGNRLGIHTILVKPINKKESLFVRLKRFPERYILKRYYEAMEQKENSAD
ncbi:MAG TPA: YqeG family HAD IIIA-type phosphatase [Clostridiaceae bacterium]|jgi:HAD superfamily phosphatase (TIGR01668 family)|nr:YqeG family HAD IIIA-type phosphatase [Clostridiaceae bacterium]